MFLQRIQLQNTISGMWRFFVSFFLFIILPQMCVFPSETKNSSVLMRSFYPTSDRFSYQNVYTYTAVHYNSSPNLTLHMTLVKGRGEPGYYPQGYFGDTEHGIFENGSYYVQLTDLGNWKRIIFGNYLPSFGQGLLFGGSYPLIFSTPYYEIARYNDRISPSGSASKAYLLEGVVFEYGIGDVRIRPFFSWNTCDCSAGESSYYKYYDNDSDGVPNDEDEDDFTGISDGFPRRYSCKTNLFTCIREEGDYGEECDREKRNNLREYIAGLNVSVSASPLKFGGTLAYSRFNRMIDPYYDYDPEKGDKTGSFYRGKDLFSSNLYFKLYGPFEIFGEVVGTFHRCLSYYPEFNGDFSSAVGFAGGVRKKFGNTGWYGWGAFLPARLVNHHAMELPDGSNNVACGLVGFHHMKSPKQFIGWIYAHAELYNTDSPGDEETGVSLSYRYRYSFVNETVFQLRQSFDVIDNYYYAPLARSYKITTKLSTRHPLSERMELVFRGENRTGASEEERIHVGVGVSAELMKKGEKGHSSFQILYYITDDDRFAWLYPYERSLYRWSFIPPAVYGRGVVATMTLVTEIGDGVVAGTKVRYNLDYAKEVFQEASVYALVEYSF